MKVKMVSDNETTPNGGANNIHLCDPVYWVNLFKTLNLIERILNCKNVRLIEEDAKNNRHRHSFFPSTLSFVCIIGAEAWIRNFVYI